MYGSYIQINSASMYILSPQVMVRHSSDLAKEQAVSDLNSKVQQIVENIAQLRHQLNDIVSTVIQGPYFIWQQSVATFCWLFYHINVAHEYGVEENIWT